ncbi:PolC-type DNA polymerase III [Rhodococcus sp. NPDC056960]|uniref:3'-5' exonuclease n=1 Tax=Rhodococcus sp. NPDC056960 TaxID=3345982 RepID=UPI003630B431
MKITTSLRRYLGGLDAPEGALLQQNWRDTDFVVVDLETTGLDARRDHIVSYGAVPVRDGRIRVGESVYSLVKAPRAVPAESTRIHGIRTQDLDEAPPLATCVETLDELLANTVVVAHGAWVERTFLRRAFHVSHRTFACPIVDTAQLAMPFLDVTAESDCLVSLEYAATALHLPIHTPHHALGDALTTANLFIALAGRLEHERAVTGTPLTTGVLLEPSTPQ